MSITLNDRTRETSTTTGTGAVTLGGAPASYQPFSAALSNGATTWYCIANTGANEWEVGSGVFTAPSTLTRAVVLSSSNGNALVNFSAGTKDVFVTIPAGQAYISQNISQDVAITPAGVATVTGIQTVPASNVLPTPGQTLTYNLIWTPANFTGLKLWLRSDTGIHTSGSNVTQWDDQSGNANNATASANWPTYAASGGPGGVPRVLFSGSQHIDGAANILTAGNDRTVWVIFKPTANANPSTWLTFRKSAPYVTLQYSYGQSTGYMGSDGVSFNITGVTTGDTGNTAELIQWSIASGTWTMYSDGASLPVAGSGASSESGPTGYQIATNSNSQFATGEIYEIIVIDHVASSVERNDVATYVQARYGITVAGAGVQPSFSGWAATTEFADSSLTLDGQPLLIGQTGNGNQTITSAAGDITVAPFGKFKANAQTVCSFPNSNPLVSLATAGFIIDNTAVNGQTIFAVEANGTMMGGFRADYGGNFNWHCNDGYHQFYGDLSYGASSILYMDNPNRGSGYARMAFNGVPGTSIDGGGFGVFGIGAAGSGSHYRTGRERHSVVERRSDAGVVGPTRLRHSV